MCKSLFPPKAELSPKIRIRETILASFLPFVDRRATHSSNHHMPVGKEHSRAIKSTRLLRQVNPDQASLWLHNDGRALANTHYVY